MTYLLYTKDLYEPKYHLIIIIRGETGVKHFKGPKDFIKSLNIIKDVHSNFGGYNQNK